MTVAGLPVLLALLGLGTWQAGRLREVEALKERIAVNVDRPPLGNAELARGVAAGDLDWRQVSLRGSWVWDGWLVVDRQYRLSVPGYHLFMPLQLADPPGSRVLVDRGWVPKEGFEERLEQERRANAPAVVTGLARYPDRREGPVEPAEAPGPDGVARRWHDQGIASMNAHLGRPAEVWFVRAGTRVADDRPKGPAGSWPEGVWTTTYQSRPHLQYAITWYGLALALFGTWLAVSLRDLGQEERPRGPRDRLDP